MITDTENKDLRYNTDFMARHPQHSRWDPSPLPEEAPLQGSTGVGGTRLGRGASSFQPQPCCFMWLRDKPGGGGCRHPDFPETERPSQRVYPDEGLSADSRKGQDPRASWWAEVRG